MARGIELSTTAQMWELSVKRYPNKPAIIDGDTDRMMSFHGADRFARRIARHMADEFGVTKGDRVAMLLPNCAEYFLAYWAAVISGAVVVPVNTRVRPGLVKHIVDSTESKILFVDSTLQNEAAEVIADPGACRLVTLGFEAEGAATWGALVDGGSSDFETAEWADDDLAIIMHTSGTTGRPKGAVMHQDDLVVNIRNAIIGNFLRHEDVHLLVVPMFHATALYSLLPASAYLGSTIVPTRAQKPAGMVDVVERHRCTTFFGVPTLFHFVSTLPDLEKRDMSCLRLIAYAGSMMPPETIRRLRERLPGVVLHNFFGLTETISLTHVLPSHMALLKPDSIGLPLPEVGQAILDEEGVEVPAGKVGELCFRVENVVRGYWKEPERMAESVRGGYFHTGDLASVDTEGYTYIKGRSKDMIIVAGENVYCHEVELVLLDHPMVLEAAAVGIPATGIRKALGELIKAAIVLRPDDEGNRPDAKIAEKEIKRHCVQKLSSYQVPHIYEFREDLPRNATGKVVKGQLK